MAKISKERKEGSPRWAKRSQAVGRSRRGDIRFLGLSRDWTLRAEQWWSQLMHVGRCGTTYIIIKKEKKKKPTLYCHDLYTQLGKKNFPESKQGEEKKSLLRPEMLSHCGLNTKPWLCLVLKPSEKGKVLQSLRVKIGGPPNGWSCLEASSIHHTLYLPGQVKLQGLRCRECLGGHLASSLEGWDLWLSLSMTFQNHHLLLGTSDSASPNSLPCL